MSKLIEVTTTLASQETAQHLARQLVDARLAGCVQITGPIESVYRWNDAVQCESEWRCTVKSFTSLQKRVLEFIAEHHPYDVPEILVLQVEAASYEYAQWLRSQVDESGT